MRKVALCAAILAGALLLAMGSCRLPFCPTGEDPIVVITKPTAPTGSGTQVLGQVILFGWRAGNARNPRSVRYMYSQVVDSNGVYNPSFDIVADMNKHPGRYESKWGPWISFTAPGDSGRTTVLGDDEILQLNRSHIFAVQAMDLCGRITGQFDRRTNVRQFIVSAAVAPILTVTEPFLGGCRYTGMNLPVTMCECPPGIALNFRWRADASSYGSVISGYRYGWDVADINNPDDWEVGFSPSHTSAPPKTLYSGVHELYVEAIDEAGIPTLGIIEVDIVPFTMDRNLLWVDDLMSTQFPQVDYSFPTESQHDAFWLNICSRAQGFDPGTDVYDAYYTYNGTPPPLVFLGRYRNIIWSFGSSNDGGVWDNVIHFIPESMIGAGSTPATQVLSMFLAKGGHLLTEGHAEQSGFGLGFLSVEIGQLILRIGHVCSCMS